MAFDSPNVSSIDVRTRRLSEDAIAPHSARYIYEVVASLPDARLAQLQREFDIFEMSGVVTTQIDRVLRRAECLADADRILEGFPLAS